MSDRTRYLALDSHKETIAVAVADDAAPEDLGMIPNDPTAVRKLVARVGGPGTRLVSAYEAGPTGYALHYRATVRSAEERVRRLEASLRTAIESSPQAQLVATLQSLRGVAFLTAATIAAEAGDLSRFATAGQFMAYAGLVPSEYSSGASRHRGHITKTGNELLRHVLGEAAHHAWRPPQVSRTLKNRQENLPQSVVDLSWKTQQRLHLRYRHLSGRLGRPKALTAVARELAGFVWALSRLVEDGSSSFTEAVR